MNDESIKQEPDRYQPPAGYSRLGRDIQTGRYVDVAQAARRQGLYVIGATGTGKSGLIENLIIQDIKQGIGVCVLDPHGDLTNNVLARLPDTRVVDGVRRAIEEDVILLDITAYQYPFGLNLFACPDPTNPIVLQRTVDQVYHVFEKIYGVGRDTPLILQYLRNCTQTLVTNPGYTMADIPLLLTDKNCRQTLLTKVKSPQVQLFWRDYDEMPPSERRIERGNILRRVEEFLQDLTFPIVGQAQSTINLRSVMDERKILLVKLDATLESVTSLIGSLIIAQFLNAAYSRADLPENKRKQFNLYADEFQRFATEDFAILLTEARKFGIGTTIAHQFRDQLDKKNKGSSLTVANLVVFRVQPEDATELAGRFNITPQEAWEEELEEEWVEVVTPQRHERKEEQVEVEVEDDILEVTQDPVDYLVTARGTHVSMRVREITQNLLTELQTRNTTKMLINNLLVAVMEGSIQVKTDEFIDLIQRIAIVYADMTYFQQMDSYMLHFAKNRDFIRSLILVPYDRKDTAWQTMDPAQKREIVRNLVFAPVNYDDVTQEVVDDEVIRIIKERPYKELPEGANLSKMTRKERLPYLVSGYISYGFVIHDALNIKSFVISIAALAEELAREPIRVPTGKKRMVKRIQPHITYLTHESEKITHPRIAIMHPQRSYADMLNEVASELANLPQFTAQAKIATEGKAVEHTVITLEPERGIRGIALDERIANIQKQNIKSGYVRELATVEEEIRTRQEQCSQPPQEPPDAIYRRQPH